MIDRFLYTVLLGIILQLTSSGSVFSQHLIQLIARENNHPLPYASILNHTRQQLFFSNEKGELEHHFKTGDSISISYVGYLPFNFRFNGKEFLQVSLLSDKKLLDEVIIKPCSNWLKSTSDNLAGDSSDRTFGGLHWIENSLNAKVAVFLPSADKKSYLADFSFWLEKSDFSHPSSFKAPIKFSFYELNDSTGLPGDLISAKQIIYQPKKTGKQTINADSLSIKIPENGMYLCFEIPFDKKYAQQVKILTDDNKEGTVHHFYGGRLDGIYSRKNVLAFFDYLQNNWHFAINRTKEDMYKTHGTIKLTYTFKSCAE